MQGYPEGVELEAAECPNGCMAGDVPVLAGRDRLHGIPGEFSIVQCQQCGLQRVSPRPTPATIGAYYPEDYGPYHADLVAVRLPRGFAAWLHKHLRLQTRVLPPLQPGRMLEIGCASGSYMEHARSLGWRVDGIEFSESAATVARRKGFSVQSGSLEQARPPEQAYDLVVAWMVLEHLHQPVEALRRVREWMQPGGYLVALVPDAGSLARTLFKNRCYDLHLPAHLFHYTPRTLTMVLENAGWEVTRVFWQRNCNTLLWSLQYWAEENELKTTLRFAKWLRTAHAARRLRLLLGVMLGALRQSGRIEVWARPAQAKRGT